MSFEIKSKVQKISNKTKQSVTTAGNVAGSGISKVTSGGRYVAGTTMKYYRQAKGYVLSVQRGLRRLCCRFKNEVLPIVGGATEDFWHTVQRLARKTKAFSGTVKGKFALGGAATFVTVFVAVFIVLAETAPYAVYADGKVVENPWSVNINGEETMIVASEKAGKQVIQGIKDEYLYEGSDVKKCDIEPQIELVEKDLKRGDDPPVVTTVEDAVTYIVNGTKELDTYTVKEGDTVWGIAVEQDISIDELQEMNEGIDIEDIHAGDSINLYKIDPIVNVTSTEVYTYSRLIKRHTEYINTNDLYEGQTKVKEEGCDGAKQVTSKISKINGEITSNEVLESKVTKQPEDRVVYRGTKSVYYGSSSGSSRSYNSASYYTSYNSSKGSALIAYASQFLGNPYRWGGSSLTNGTDCSGFVMSVYSHFGVSLPHSSYSDRSVGHPVSVSDIRPGDIVCYSGHVALYAGGGRIIHASTYGTGICYSNLHYRSIICVRRIFI